MPDYVTMAEHESLGLEAESLRSQLVACLEELASREREVNELHNASLRYHTKMQTFQVRAAARV